MQAVLVMFRSDGERRSFSLSREMTVLGRRQDCDLMIPLGEISRKHCRFIKEGGILRLEDLGSSNGTFCNGRRIQEAVLAAGDTIQVGPVTFVLQKDGIPGDDELRPFGNSPKSAEDSAAGASATEDSGIGMGAMASTSTSGSGRRHSTLDDDDQVEAIPANEEPQELETIIRKPAAPPRHPSAAAVPPPPPGSAEREDDLDVIEDHPPLEDIESAGGHDEPLDVLDDQPIQIDNSPISLDDDHLNAPHEDPMIEDDVKSLSVATPGEPVSMPSKDSSGHSDLTLDEDDLLNFLDDSSGHEAIE